MRKSIGVVDGIVLAASSTAATSSIGIGLGLMASIVGLHLPAIMLLAFLPVLGIAGGYGRLNRVAPNAGSSYKWVGRVFSPWLGFLVGWVNVVGTIVFMAYTTTVTGSAIIQLLGQADLHSVGGLSSIRTPPSSPLFSAWPSWSLPRWSPFAGSIWPRVSRSTC